MSKSRAEQAGGTAPTPDKRRLGAPRLRTLALVTLAGLVGYNAGNTGQNVDQAVLNSLRDRQAATSKQLNTALNTLAATQGINKNTLLGRGLTDPSELPGQGNRVTEQQRDKLGASSVAILARPKENDSYYWGASCSGNKITAGKASYILTASHCLEPGFDPSRVLPHTYAADVLPVDSRKYAIARASTDSIRDNRTPVAKVTAASIIVGGKYRPDMALLKVNPVSEGKSAGVYDSIPGISFKDYVSRPPQLGSEVAFYGVPSSVEKVAIGGIGTYLGRVHPDSDHQYRMDVFGFNINDAHKDPVEFGSSGSSAIGANGHMFGPLTRRYGSEAEKHSPLPTLYSPYELTYRLQHSETLDIDTSQYTVLGATTVPPWYVFQDLVSGLDYDLAGVR